MDVIAQLTASRDVVFVGGKGGVGKTTVASAVALDRARRGRPTLVVSTDPAHNLGHLWARPIGDAITRVAPGLRALEIDPQRTTDAHLRSVRRTMRRLLPEHLESEVDRHLDLARDAPGTHEAAVLERLAEVVEQREDDELLVVDTAPSGHTTRLMELPELMQSWTEGLLRRQERSARFGSALRGLRSPDAEASAGADRRARRDAEIRAVLDRRRDRFRLLRELLRDSRRTGFVIVLAAERLPVLETVELHSRLAAAGIEVAALVVNKRSPREAGELLETRRRLEDGHLESVRRELPGLPVIELPLMGGDIVAAEGLGRLIPHLVGP